MHNSPSLLRPHRKGHAKISRLKHKSTLLTQQYDHASKRCASVQTCTLHTSMYETSSMLLYTEAIGILNYGEKPSSPNFLTSKIGI